MLFTGYTYVDTYTRFSCVCTLCMRIHKCTCLYVPLFLCLSANAFSAIFNHKGYAESFHSYNLFRN